MVWGKAALAYPTLLTFTPWHTGGKEDITSRKGKRPPSQPMGRQVRSPSVTTDRGESIIRSIGASVQRWGPEHGGYIVYPAIGHKPRQKFYRWLAQHKGRVQAYPCEWLAHRAWFPPMVMPDEGIPGDIPTAFLVLGNLELVEELRAMSFVRASHPALDVTPPHRAAGMGETDSPAMRRYKRDRTLPADLADLHQAARDALVETFIVPEDDPSHPATVERAERTIARYADRID